MDNKKLTGLVRYGLKRSGIVSEDGVKAVVNAIELALDMEADEERAADPPAPKMEPTPDRMPLPIDAVREVPAAPPRSAAENPPEVSYANSAIEPPSHSQAARAEEVKVVLASDADATREISRSGQLDPAPIKRIRLQSINGQSRQATLESAQAAIESQMPATISVIAEGRTEEIKLVRSVRQLPSTGRDRKADMLKVCYLAAGAPLEMETQELLTIADIMAGVDVAAVCSSIIKRARQIYRPRPISIEPRRPTVPTGNIDVLTEEGSAQEQANMANKLKRMSPDQVGAEILKQ